MDNPVQDCSDAAEMPTPPFGLQKVRAIPPEDQACQGNDTDMSSGNLEFSHRACWPVPASSRHVLGIAVEQLLRSNQLSFAVAIPSLLARLAAAHDLC